MGQRIRTVDLEPPLKQTDNTYNIYFTTVEKSTAGFELNRIKWTALVNLDSFEPTPNNPLGIYITNFDIKPLEGNNK
jgi:hypothetical protein